MANKKILSTHYYIVPHCFPNTRLVLQITYRQYLKNGFVITSYKGVQKNTKTLTFFKNTQIFKNHNNTTDQNKIISKNSFEKLSYIRLNKSKY